jgi:hypothetical protein
VIDELQRVPNHGAVEGNTSGGNGKPDEAGKGKGDGDNGELDILRAFVLGVALRDKDE